MQNSFHSLFLPTDVDQVKRGKGTSSDEWKSSGRRGSPA